MFRWEIINKYIKEKKFKSYLEIGIKNKNFNFNKIECENKIGVDPDYKTKAEYAMTSDEFFKINKNKFDCIFIDGFHEYNQLNKDIKNSLKCLNKNGIIFCHDVFPLSKETCLPPLNGKERDEIWNGDCYKSWMEYNFLGEYYCCLYISMDEQIGIIDTSKKHIPEILKYDINNLTYEQFMENIPMFNIKFDL